MHISPSIVAGGKEPLSSIGILHAAPELVMHLRSCEKKHGPASSALLRISGEVKRCSVSQLT
jgi:hypothetical protein